MHTGFGFQWTYVQFSQCRAVDGSIVLQRAWRRLVRAAATFGTGAHAASQNENHGCHTEVRMYLPLTIVGHLSFSFARIRSYQLNEAGVVKYPMT